MLRYKIKIIVVTFLSLHTPHTYVQVKYSINLQKNGGEPSAGSARAEKLAAKSLLWSEVAANV